MSKTILHITDSHGGLMSGLLAPDTELTYDNDEKRTLLLSSTSQWVWECFSKLIDTTIDYAADDPVLVYHTGDAAHGATFPDYLYSSHQNHQEEIAVKALSELRRIPTLAGIRFAHGTAEHDYNQQGATKNIASACAAWGYPISCVTYGVEEVDGCQVDFAHLGPTISTGEDKALTGRRYVIRLVYKFLQRGQRAPDIILRGHVHQRVTEMVTVPWGKQGKQVLLSVGAPLTGPNEFARNASKNCPISEIGGTLIKVHNGRVIDYAAVTWEREERQRIDGLVAHPYQGGYQASGKV